MVAGDQEVGKTSLVKRYLGKGFSPEYIPTVGMDMFSKKYKKDNLIIDLRIWNLGGQISFRTPSLGYAKGADVVILVFDVTRKESYLNIEEWHKKIYRVLERNKAGNVPCMIIGNKTDLKTARVVDMKQGIKISEGHNALYVETSAKEGEGVDEAFDQLIFEFIEVYEKLEK